MDDGRMGAALMDSGPKAQLWWVLRAFRDTPSPSYTSLSKIFYFRARHPFSYETVTGLDSSVLKESTHLGRESISRERMALGEASWQPT